MTLVKSARFSAADHVIFWASLLASGLVGLYLVFRSKIHKNVQKETFKDYLTGYKKHAIVPVAMTLLGNYISGITILGTPAEIYHYGTNYWWFIIIAISLSSLTVATVYVPVFMKLQVASSYEYLELRFNKTLRIMASVFFLFDEIFFLPLVIYVPSLAFNQATGFNLHLVAAVSDALVVSYVILGGLKAVIYTDVYQTVLMFFSNIVVLIVGIVIIGGFGVIINRGYDGGRFPAPDFYPSMYARYNVYIILIGGFTYWTAFNGVHQTMVQRYLSLPDQRQVNFALLIFTISIIFFVSMCCFAGLLLYAVYYDCDPLAAEHIVKSDQILAYFVMEKIGHLKGIPGLFIAGVFGAALSSLSVVLNSTAVVLLEDFFRGVFHFKLTEKQAWITTKIIVFLLGIVGYVMIFAVELTDSIFEIGTVLTSIAAGVMLGVFSLGMLLPWSNAKGAIAGAICGFIVMVIVGFGGQAYVLNGKLIAPKLPISIEGCYEHYGINATEKDLKIPDASDIFPLFRIAFYWVTPIGVVTVLIVGIATSFITGKTDLKTLDPELITPVLHWLLPEESQQYAGSAVERIKHQRLLEGEPTAAEETPDAGTSSRR